MFWLQNTGILGGNISLVVWVSGISVLSYLVAGWAWIKLVRIGCIYSAGLVEYICPGETYRMAMPHIPWNIHTTVAYTRAIYQCRTQHTIQSVPVLILPICRIATRRGRCRPSYRVTSRCQVLPCMKFINTAQNKGDFNHLGEVFTNMAGKSNKHSS